MLSDIHIRFSITGNNTNLDKKDVSKALDGFLRMMHRGEFWKGNTNDKLIYCYTS